MVVLAGISPKPERSHKLELDHALTMAITRSQTRNKQKDSETGLHHINTSRNKPRKPKNIAARRSKAQLAYRRERLQTAIRAQSWTHKQSHWINRLDMTIAAFKQSQRARPSDNSTKPLPYDRVRPNSRCTARRTVSGSPLKNAAFKSSTYYETRRLKFWRRLVEGLHLPLEFPVQDREQEPHNRS
jgi:hypothetical protein